MNKSNLREEIFKLVYSLEVQKEDESSQIDLYLENSELSDKEKEKIKEEVCKIIDLKEDIENQISKNLKSGWSIERISKVNISILRIAIYEIFDRLLTRFNFQTEEIAELYPFDRRVFGQRMRIAIQTYQPARFALADLQPTRYLFVRHNIDLHVYLFF